MSVPVVSIVIPVYRDAAVIEETVALLSSHLHARGTAFELILVHDGGPETTRQMLWRLQASFPYIRVIDRPENRGKGYSVREGLGIAGGSILVYTDADLPYDLTSLEHVLETIQRGQADVALASRRAGTPSEARHQNLLRRFMHNVFAALVSRTFRIPCSDTQAGLKAMTAAVRNRVLPELSVDRYAFDVEFALIAHRGGFRLQDIPATRRRTDGTNVRVLRDSWHMLGDLWRIWKRHHPARAGWGVHAALVSAAATLAIFGLWHIPTSPTMWFDDGSAASVAKNVAEHGVYGIQTAPGVFVTDMYWLTIQQPVILPVAAIFALFGTSIFAAKLVMFVYMVATVIAAFLLVREISNGRVATWSVWLLVTFSPFYGNGKAMLGETPGVFWLLFGSWCWLRAQKSEHRAIAWWGAAGIALGLCVITKPYYLLLLPAIAIVKIVSWIRSRAFPFSREIAFALPLIALPLVWFFQLVPKPLSWASVSTMGRFFSNSYGDPITLALMAENALRFLTESTPLHLTLMLGIILLSLLRLRPQQWHAPLVMIGIFVALSLFWYVKTPGWYRYFYSVHLLLIVLMPLALWRLKFPWLQPWIKRTALLLLIAAQLTVTFQNRDLYNSHALFALGEAVARETPDRPLFLAHVPEAAMVLPSERMEQAIYINPALTIGTNWLLEGDLPEVVVTSAPGAVGTGAIESVLRTHYRLLWSQGHYRLFERIEEEAAP